MTLEQLKLYRGPYSTRHRDPESPASPAILSGARATSRGRQGWLRSLAEALPGASNF